MLFVSTALVGCKDNDDNGAGQPGVTPAVESGVVDLGLPSGTLWAKANLGATTETETGNFYAWAETYAKGNYSLSNYFDPSCTAITGNITGSGNDAAKAALGGEWQMPTKAQFKELFDNCKVTRVTKSEEVSGKTVTTVIGIKFVGPNEQELYLPAIKGSVAGDATTLYDSYLDEKSKTAYAKYENVYASYWTGEISTGIANANQYAVQMMYVEHAKNAVKAGALQYDGVYYNRSRLVGAPIRPVKASGGAPIADYVDIRGAWAESDAAGTEKALTEKPVFMAFEGSNFTGEGVIVQYGTNLDKISYSRNVNELNITNTAESVTTKGTVAYEVAPNPEDPSVKAVISVTDQNGDKRYFVKTTENPAVNADALKGKWDFTYNSEALTLNILDGSNCQVTKGTSKVATDYDYRFGTFNIASTNFTGVFGVEATGTAETPFKFVNSEGATTTFTVHPKTYQTVFSWSGLTSTEAPSIMTLNSNNSLVDATTIKQDILSGLDGQPYPYAVRLNKSMATSTIGEKSTQAAELTTNAVLVTHDFKTGDRIRIRGFFNSSGKTGSFKVFDKDAIFLGTGTPGFVNYADGAHIVSESIFTFTKDVKNVYISREAGTGTFVCEFYIETEVED